jgi:hypothetical protein
MKVAVERHQDSPIRASHRLLARGFLADIGAADSKKNAFAELTAFAVSPTVSKPP